MNMTALDAKLSDRFIDELASKNYCVAPHAISTELLASLRKAMSDRDDLFRAAKVGSSVEASSQPLLRNDEISWIHGDDLKPAEKALFTLLEGFQAQLNRELFLGLTDFEAHYARYKKGHYYARHLDRFRGGAITEYERVVSLVLYLNEDWSAADGGHLRLYVTDPQKNSPQSSVQAFVDVLPQGGTLVCFTSDQIEHEVLPANRERKSIAIWFRRKK